MPPASRGLLYFALLRRYASGPGAIPKTRSTRIPAAAKNPTLAPARRKTARAPEDSAPNGQRTRQDQFRIDESEGPAEPRRPHTAPAAAPPLLERLLDRFHPRVRGVVHFTFRLIPWIPPFLLLQLHLPYQIMWVNGPSMSPFLNTHFSNNEVNSQDCVLVDRFREFKKPVSGFENTGTQRLERGMIIVFHTPHDPNKIAVKRIVGLPGDRVQPLIGYSNTTDTPPRVVVPWNHLWVEGDVDDRTKSVDSNWYGPISKCLVIGQVKSVLSPWYSPTAVRWHEHSYPAQERVEQNAVRAIDPDAMSEMQSFRDGSPLRFLQALKQNPEIAEANAQTRKGKMELRAMLQQCWRVEDSGDAELAKIARAVAAELEALLNMNHDQKVAKKDLESLVTS